MARRQFVAAMSGFAGAMIGLAAGVLLGRWSTSPSVLDLAEPSNWTMIRSVNEIIDPNEGLAAAKVYFVWHPSDSRTAKTIFQNRIEISSPRATAAFQWQKSDDFGASWCEIEDLDGDGSKEFILIQKGRLARVVTYANGAFGFREGPRDGTDELLSSAGDIELIDLDQDGLLEFVDVEAIGDVAHDPVSREVRYGPRVRKWSKTLGFHETSEDLVEAYRRLRHR